MTNTEVEYGWGKDNELLYELWPMEIPEDRMQDVHPNDEPELPLRVAMSGLLHNPTTKE